MIAASPLVCALACVVLATAALAQKPADEPGSTVSGRVFCADTNAPARAATVVLEPVSVVEGIKPGELNHGSFHGDVSETLLDGSFVLHRVPPGSYYVVATAPGYLSPLADATFPGGEQPVDPAAPKKPLAAPRITVQPGLPVSVNVTLERGSSVSGTVLFDDGSPAAGLRVTLLVRAKDEWIHVPSNPFDKSGTGASTDDQGNYRIAGLPPREYLPQVELERSHSSFSVDEAGGTGMTTNYLEGLTFYSGGKTRQDEGVPFTLSAGEDRHGEDLEIPVSKLHTVRGSLIAARDGHVLNGGHITLRYVDGDKTPVSSTEVSADDQAFTFAYVPEGDYILSIDSAQDLEFVEVPNPPNSRPRTRTESRVVHNYDSANQLIHITGDTTGVVVSVPELKPQKAFAP